MRQMKWIAPVVALGLVLTWGMVKAADANVPAADAAKGSITGKVTDSTGNAVANAVVMFVKAKPVGQGERGAVPKVEGQPPHKPVANSNTTKTAADGTYTFANVAPGDYMVSAKLEGTGKATPVKVTVKAGEAATADLVLQKPDAAKPKG